MKLIQLLGTTSSGKSDLAVDLALAIQKTHTKVVIVSCDSRQVYTELNLASGKVVGTAGFSNILGDTTTFFYREIEHYLINIVSVSETFTLLDYVENFSKIVSKLESVGVEYIIMTGGTGMYARSIWEEYQLKQVSEEDKPEFDQLKTELSKLILQDLQSQLNEDTFNDSDWNNSRRLVNAILKNRFKGEDRAIVYPKFDKKIKFVIDVDFETLRERILLRLSERLAAGMIPEIEKILINYGDEILYNLGLECRYIMLFLTGVINREQLEDKLTSELLFYVKRQNTWLSKEKDAVRIVHLDDILGAIELW